MTDLVEALPAPEQRGRLQIEDSVVETIARAAAAGVSPQRRATGLSRITTTDLPQARVVVRAGHVEVSVVVAAQWPTPVVALARQVQDVVTRQVRDYTGLAVVRVDVDVRCIPTDERTTARRVQ